MFDIIKNAVDNFIKSIDGKIEECDNKPKKGFVSKITVTGDKNYDIYIVIPEEKLIYMANYYFGEDEYDAEDLTKEIANLIIGNAKVLADKENIHFNIGIPEYLGEYSNNIKYDGLMCFKFNSDKCFYILFKEKP